MSTINSLTCDKLTNFNINFNGNSPLVGEFWVSYNSTDINKKVMFGLNN